MRHVAGKVVGQVAGGHMGQGSRTSPVPTARAVGRSVPAAGPRKDIGGGAHVETRRKRSAADAQQPSRPRLHMARFVDDGWTLYCGGKDIRAFAPHRSSSTTPVAVVRQMIAVSITRLGSAGRSSALPAPWPTAGPRLVRVGRPLQRSLYRAGSISTISTESTLLSVANRRSAD